MLPMGIMPYNLTIVTTAVMLIEYLLAVVVGAKLYAENGGRDTFDIELP